MRSEMAGPVRTICLIRDKRPFWTRVEDLLLSANARVEILENPSASKISSGTKPDLIIVGDDVYQKIFHFVHQLPRLIIEEGGLGRPLIRSGETRDVVFANWPAVERIFLEITSRMLNLSERREYKTLIRVFPDGQQGFQMGWSEDFSLTGMAFRTDLKLEQGQKVTISFHVPGINSHMQLAAEIVRRIQDSSDESNHYGVVFIAVDAETRETLYNFVWKDS